MLRALVISVLWFAASSPARAGDGGISGRVTDPRGNPVSGAVICLLADHNSPAACTSSDAGGRFALSSPTPSIYRISAAASGFAAVTRIVQIADGEPLTVDLQFSTLARHTDSIVVSSGGADADVEHPDPSQRVIVRTEALDANPGRPGQPVSIPGLPAETASGGIKAPQYFAPGVAGDHGEPIAKFFQVGSYLVPNNLSANAHGNGYADPNVIIPAVIESVTTDGGSFNVAEGNHSVDLSTVYGIQSRLEPFVAVAGDARDADVSAGWSPNSAARAWLAMEASYGNGFLDTPEHRQQYKFNAFRVFDIGRHTLTVFAIGYYGQSRIPGLAPIDIPNLHDTIDPRQRDQTHTGEAALNDSWQLSPSARIGISTFFRTYNLALYSNFGDGLIRQSEFRTVTGDNFTYTRKIARQLSVLAGFDYLREAPRRLDLDHYESANTAVYGPFEKVTANNVTLSSLASYVAIDGWILPWLRYNAGWRRDQIDAQNTDLLRSANSYQDWAGVNSPKATIAILPPERLPLPSVSFSFGQSFFTNDPRIGTGTSPGTPVSRAHAYQIVINRLAGGIDWRITLGRVTQEASLAKIDPDTGLQYNEGPGRNRYVTASARRYFRGAMLQASVSKADARDLSDGTPVSEAPRLILDVLGTLDRLPLALRARGEFEEVGRKPLGDGFVSVPVREIRGALTRSFGDRLEAGINFVLASGYAGQTTEILALPGDPAPFERITGVHLPSFAALSVRYRLGRLRP